MQFTENIEKIVHYILVKREFLQKDIVEEFGIAKSYVSRIINRFIYAGYVARAAKNYFKVIEPHRLLLLWATHREPRFAETRTNLPMPKVEIENYFMDNHPEHALGLGTAFSRRLKTKGVRQIKVYMTEKEIEKIKNNLGWDKHGNVVVFPAQENEMFGREGNLCSIYINFVDMYARGMMGCFRLLNHIPNYYK